MIKQTTNSLNRFTYYFPCGKYFLRQYKGNWLTEVDFVASPEVLWRRFFDTSETIGVRFDNYTRYFVIDLDKGSTYHYRYDPIAYYQIKTALATIGINETIVVRSSGNGGIHLYGFLPKEINTFDLACGLYRILTDNKFQVSPGQLEIFPNTKQYSQPGEKTCGYNGHRLPLQPGTGSCLLNKQMKPVPGTINKFLKLADKTSQQQNFTKFKRYCSYARTWYIKNQRSPQKSRKENYVRDLKSMAFIEWTERGQTNQHLKSIANYGVVVKKIEDQTELAKFIVTTATTRPGYTKYCAHQHEIVLRAKHWAKSALNYWSKRWNQPERHGKLYKDLLAETEGAIQADLNKKVHQPRKIKHTLYGEINRKRHDEFRHRLITVIKTIGKLPQKVEQAIAQIQNVCLELFGSKFSRKTLNKPENKVIWHYKYRPQRLEQAPFLNLQTLIRIGSYIEQNYQKYKLITTDIRLQNQDTVSTQKEIPQQSVLQNLKKPALNTQTSFSVKDTQIDPTMKCLALNPQLRLSKFLLQVQSIKLKLAELLQKYLKTSSQKIGQTSFVEFAKLTKIRDLIRLLNRGSQQIQSLNQAKYQEVREVRDSLAKDKRQRDFQSYVYVGAPKTIFKTDIKDQTKTKSRLLPGESIQLSDELHSSEYRDDLSNSLVYVTALRLPKPIAVSPLDLISEQLFPEESKILRDKSLIERGLPPSTRPSIQVGEVRTGTTRISKQDLQQILDRAKH